MQIFRSQVQLVAPLGSAKPVSQPVQSVRWSPVYNRA
jgi:hypothetical protein